MSQERASRPTCMYKAGPFGKPMSRVFDHPDDVPEGEGWVESPANVEPAKRSAKKPAKKAAA